MVTVEFLFTYLFATTEYSLGLGVYVSGELHETGAKITVIRVGTDGSIYTTTKQ